MSRELVTFFVYGDFQRAQEFVILRGQLDLACGFKRSRNGGFAFGRLAILLVPLVEPDGGFQNEENVVPGPLNLPDGLGDAIRVGKRLVDRVTQFLHQNLQTFFQAMPLSPGPGAPMTSNWWMRRTTRKFHFRKVETI